MVFATHAVEPRALLPRMTELIPEYLPGMDTGAFESTDRRICWNKTLGAVLSVLGREKSFEVESNALAVSPNDPQLDVYWKQADGIALAATTGWGDRGSLERRLQRFESLKAAQKLFIYSCSRWQQAVLEQIDAALLRFPFHLSGEQYLFINLLGGEARLRVHGTDMQTDGAMGRYRPGGLVELPGSPFEWKTR